MSENSKKIAEDSAQSSARKLRRGISNETVAVSQLRFHEKDAANNCLFIGHLEDVSVEWSVNADGKQFQGMRCPRLSFHFASNHANVNERRHVSNSIFPIPSNVDTIPGGKDEWQVNIAMRWIKHMLEVFYLKGRQFTPEEEDALSLPFVDFDEENQYVAIEQEEVLAGYATLFTNAAAMLNGTWNGGDGKPVYKTANGGIIPIWMKLLRHRKNKNNWVNVGQNGELAFDRFIGSGVIEIQKPNTPPAILRVDMARESIVPKEVNRQPSIGGQGIPSTLGGVIANNSPMGILGGMPDSAAYGEAGADGMPF